MPVLTIFSTPVFAARPTTQPLRKVHVRCVHRHVLALASTAKETQRCCSSRTASTHCPSRQRSTKRNSIPDFTTHPPTRQKPKQIRHPLQNHRGSSRDKLCSSAKAGEQARPDIKPQSLRLLPTFEGAPTHEITAHPTLIHQPQCTN